LLPMSHELSGIYVLYGTVCLSVVYTMFAEPGLDTQSFSVVLRMADVTYIYYLTYAANNIKI